MSGTQPTPPRPPPPGAPPPGASGTVAPTVTPPVPPTRDAAAGPLPTIGPELLAAGDLPDPTPEQIAALQGAQVVLDPAGKAAQGAKGIHDYLALNIAHRDEGYVELGLDPHDPNGDVLDPEPPPPVEPPPGTRSGARAAPPAGPPTPRPPPATKA